MDRQTRRKIANRFASDVLKGRELATAKKQWGFGFIITNRMVSFTFWRWVWTPWDRRIDRKQLNQQRHN